MGAFDTYNENVEYSYDVVHQGSILYSTTYMYMYLGIYNSYEY